MSGPDALRTMTVPEAVRGPLAWVEATQARFADRAPHPGHVAVALAGQSALAFAAGDLASLNEHLSLLARTHSVANELCFERGAPTCILDAADFDATQRESSRPWDHAPKHQTGPGAATNHLRVHALRNAVTVTVADHDFAVGGDHFTISALTPGWAALVAMARVGEVEAAVGAGFTGVWRLHAAARDGLATLFDALDIDHGGVGATVERVRAREGHSTHDLTWTGPDGADAAFERCFAYVEANPEVLRTIDDARLAAGLPARSLATMLRHVEYAATSLGFQPVLGRGLDAR